MERRPITQAERLGARIEVRGNCWIWSGTYAANGYPVLTTSSGNLSVIPALWEQKNGPVPKGEVLICTHTRAGSDVCVNPAHYRPRPLKGPRRDPFGRKDRHSHEGDRQ